MIDLSARQSYVLSSEFNRRIALDAVRRARLGLSVTIDRPQRTAEQNRRLWGMLQAIVVSKATWADREWDRPDWYELFASAYLREKHLETGQTMMGMHGEILTLGRIRPSQFNTAQFAELTTSVLAWMDTSGVPWPEQEEVR